MSHGIEMEIKSIHGSAEMKAREQRPGASDTLLDEHATAILPSSSRKRPFVTGILSFHHPLATALFFFPFFRSARRGSVNLLTSNESNLQDDRSPTISLRIQSQRGREREKEALLLSYYRRVFICRLSVAKGKFFAGDEREFYIIHLCIFYVYLVMINMNL